jgi:phospholipid/cholesterol/gamma-HCH transport system permease protein
VANTSSQLLADAIKQRVLAVQEFTFLALRAIANLWHPPIYWDDILAQMDIIGVGSLPIVLLTGFFTGMVLALQMAKTLTTFGQVSLTGELVALSLVRELGPTFTSLMVAGRCASGIASELGSMLVSEQIDAMRALGPTPSRNWSRPGWWPRC